MADAIAEVERVGDGAPPNQRQIVATARWAGVPGLLVVDYDPRTGAYGVIGEGEGRGDAATVAQRRKLLDVLPNDTEPFEWWLTNEDIANATGKVKSVWLGTLNLLVNEGRVVAGGEGKKGSPNRFAKATRIPSATESDGNDGNATEADSDSVSPYRGRNRIESRGFRRRCPRRKRPSCRWRPTNSKSCTTGWRGSSTRTGTASESPHGSPPPVRPRVPEDHRRPARQGRPDGRGASSRADRRGARPACPAARRRLPSP